MKPQTQNAFTKRSSRFESYQKGIEDGRVRHQRPEDKKHACDHLIFNKKLKSSFLNRFSRNLAHLKAKILNYSK